MHKIIELVSVLWRQSVKDQIGIFWLQTKASVFFIFTIFNVSRMSRSGQSRTVTGVVSSEPSNRMWIMAGLIPGKLGPLCKKEWPIIRPATVNMLFSSSSSETDGIRWSCSPSKILMMAALPATAIDWEEKANHKVNCLKETKEENEVNLSLSRVSIIYRE